MIILMMLDIEKYNFLCHIINNRYVLLSNTIIIYDIMEHHLQRKEKSLQILTLWN